MSYGSCFTDQGVRYCCRNQRNVAVQVRETAVKPRLIKARGMYPDGRIQGFRWKAILILHVIQMKWNDFSEMRCLKLSLSLLNIVLMWLWVYNVTLSKPCNFFVPQFPFL